MPQLTREQFDAIAQQAFDTAPEGTSPEQLREYTMFLANDAERRSYDTSEQAAADTIKSGFGDVVAGAPERGIGDLPRGSFAVPGLIAAAGAPAMAGIGHGLRQAPPFVRALGGIVGATGGARAIPGFAFGGASGGSMLGRVIANTITEPLAQAGRGLVTTFGRAEDPPFMRQQATQSAKAAGVAANEAVRAARSTPLAGQPRVQPDPGDVQRAQARADRLHQRAVSDVQKAVRGRSPLQNVVRGVARNPLMRAAGIGLVGLEAARAFAPDPVREKINYLTNTPKFIEDAARSTASFIEGADRPPIRATGDWAIDDAIRAIPDIASGIFSREGFVPTARGFVAGASEGVSSLLTPFNLALAAIPGGRAAVGAFKAAKPLLRAGRGGVRNFMSRFAAGADRTPPIPGVPPPAPPVTSTSTAFSPGALPTSGISLGGRASGAGPRGQSLAARGAPAQVGAGSPLPPGPGATGSGIVPGGGLPPQVPLGGRVPASASQPVWTPAERAARIAQIQHGVAGFNRLPGGVSPQELARLDRAIPRIPTRMPSNREFYDYWGKRGLTPEKIDAMISQSTTRSGL